VAAFPVYADVPTGKRILAAMAGCSPNAAAAAVKRLEGWFCYTTEAADGYSFAPGDLVVRTLTTEKHEEQAMLHSGQSTHDEPPAATHNEYTPNRRDDVFMAGTSKTVKTWAKAMSPAAGQTWREWLQENTQAGLGETALRIVDALARAGDMTAAELAEETGKKIGSIRRARVPAGDAHRHRGRAREQPRAEDVQPAAGVERQDRGVAPDPSHLSAWRLSRRQPPRAGAVLDRTPVEPGKDAGGARRRAPTQRAPGARRAKILARLHPSQDKHTIQRMAADVPVKQWTQRRAALAAMAKMHQERDADLPAADQRRMLTLAGWTPATCTA
jgi:hypothetical protein